MKAKGTYSSKKETKLKWLLLSLSVFGGFVFAYSYDTPSSVKDLLYIHFQDNYTEAEFEVSYSLLYSLMAFPNVFMTLFLGFLIDRFKVRINYWIMSIFIALGSTITYIGIARSSFPIMYIGRFLIGSTGESIHIVEGLFLKQYFSHSEMSFIIAIIEAFLSLGGFLAFTMSPRIAFNNLLETFEIANYICICNAVFVVVVCTIDKLFELNNPQTVSITHFDDEHQRLTPPERSPEIPLDASTPNKSLQEEASDDHHEQQSPEKSEVQPEEEVDLKMEEPPKIETPNSKRAYFRMILDFPASYWFLLGGGAVALSTVQSFLIIGPSYIIDKGYEGEIANDIRHATVHAAGTVSLFRITAAVALPLFGYLIDTTGKRPLWLLVGVFLSFVNHVLVLFIHPLPCCVIYGCCYAIVATSLWPSVYTIIPKKLLGMATGMVNSVDNLGLMILPTLNGYIKSQTGSYDDSMVFLAALTFLGCLSAYKAYTMLRNQPEDKSSAVLSRRSSIAMFDEGLLMNQ